MKPALSTSALHLFTLAGFAVAQPIYDLLGRYPTFLVAHQAGAPADLITFALALSLGVPALLFGLEALLALLSARLRAIAHVGLVAVLAALFVLPPLNRAATLPTAIALSIAAGFGAAAAIGYATLPAARRACSGLALAALAFPIYFVATSPLLGSALTAPARASVANPLPVVMVVFDELSLFALMSPAGGIDAVRFPHFAALARASTWYRNATTVADYTSLALPALLTGRLPDHNRLPTVAEHPGNLFTLLAGGYELRVVEPVTQLCPADACPRQTAPAAAPSRVALFADAALLWLHMLAPADLRTRLPDIGRQWTFQFQRWLLATVAGPSRADRPAAFDAFLHAITPSATPTLYFAHVLLPHYPYEYLPSGTRYNAPPADFHRERLDLDRPDQQLGWSANNAAGAAQEQQRYLLQLALVDALLGRLLDRLRAVGLYDDALLIVTADHGVSFRPGESQRYVTATNAGDIAWVPLFIKEPGQRDGRVDDRDAQLIDLVPTIAGLLGTTPSWRVDGRSLRADGPPRAKVVFTPENPTNQLDLTRVRLAAALPDPTAATAAQRTLFGSELPIDELYRRGPLPKLVGRAAPTDAAIPPGVAVHLADAAAYDAVDPASGTVPAFVRGRLEPRAAISDPPPLAIAVNGVIAATTQSFVADDRSISFGALLPDTAFRPGANRVDVFAIDASDTEPRLYRIAPQP